MLIDINKIIVNDRIRKDFGNLEELAEDIKQNGLINPPTINKDYVLLAGERRLRACKSLGWGQIPVHMLDTKDEAHDLAVEMSENNLRRNFTGSELAEGIRRQMALESEKAKERQQATRFGSDGDGNISTTAGTARDKAGATFGISGKQAERVMFVDDHKDLLDPADFAEWDEGKLSTNNAFQRIKAAMAQAEKERDEARQDLQEAYLANENIELENESLKDQLAQRPEPEVIEREVVREVVPEDYEQLKRNNESLKHEADRLNREYQAMWHKKMELDKKLDQANVLLGEKERTDNAQWDIEVLTTATNNYLRQYGGKLWAFDQFYRVDEVTQQEFVKAMKNLAAFAQNTVQYISDTNKLEA